MGIRQNLKQLSERKKLGEILLEMSLINADQLRLALEKAAKTSSLLGNLLVAEGLVSEENMAKALSLQFNLPCVDLRDYTMPDPAAMAVIPEPMARAQQILPLELQDDTLLLAVHDPFSLVNLSSIPGLAGMRIRAMVAPLSQFQNALERFYQGASDTKLIQLIATNIQQRTETPKLVRAPKVTALPDNMSQEKRYSIENLLNKILEVALEKKASDLHFEPLKEQVRVRQRIDGILHEAQLLPIDLFPALISRIKVLAHMDIAEKRQPQDGHFQLKVGAREVDFRVSTLPTVHGEKTVLRVLDKSAQRADLPDTGMSAEVLHGIKKLLHRPFGILLVTGPTGSGKTTTAYSMIREINDLAINIITIEDPVEFELENVNQVQLNPKAGVHFANTLRSILRQDPDVIMVGEIRDKETADIAVRSALTGHLVISTLHTNNSAGTLSRLVEMGVEPFLISSSLLGVLSQRLVRKLCPHCKEAYTLTDEERELLGQDVVPNQAPAFRAKGCEQCNNIGYKGRVGIFELLIPDATIRKLVNNGQVDEPILTYLWEQKFHTMRMDGIDKVISGVTSVQEVLGETQ